MSEPRGPTQLFMQATDGVFPGPFAAAFLTLAALFTTILMVAALFGDLPLIAAAGIGQVIGMGGIAALAARRVPAPHEERLGLRGFTPRLLVPLLCLLPIVIVVSELDNVVRVFDSQLRDQLGWVAPPSPEMIERQEQMAELLEIDSV